MRLEISGVLPLQGDTSELERSWVLFPGTWAERSAKMLRADLVAAGIPVVTPDGVADFHALRHTLCTRLAKSGTSPKEAQMLARHSSITLTMDRNSAANGGRFSNAPAARSPRAS